MKKTFYYLLLILLTFTSCKEPIEKADEVFRDEGKYYLGDGIEFFSSSLDFYEYGNLENYWYSDDTTYKEILDDNYHDGYRGLTKLNEAVKKLHNTNKEISTAVQDLKNQIIIAKKDIKRKQKLMENLDIFGGFLFSSSDVLQRNDSEQKEKERQIPTNVKISFEKLISLLRNEFISIAESIHNLEVRANFIAEPNESEKVQLRINLKIYILNELNKFYTKNSDSKIAMLNFLFKLLENQYPLNSIK